MMCVVRRAGSRARMVTAGRDRQPPHVHVQNDSVISRATAREQKEKQHGVLTLDGLDILLDLIGIVWAQVGPEPR